jgi:hypothetical protein
MNGKRVPVVASDFEGIGGVQDYVVAYIPNKRGPPVAVGHSITIDGLERTVVAVAKSEYIASMTLVTFA